MDLIIKKILKDENLTFEESKSTFLQIMSGKINEEKIHDLLVGLSQKGETAEEIAGGVFALREKASKVKTSSETIDTCGTGGDGKNTLNISTASAILLSSMGIKVAKHGNKALSSKCGSADVLENLGININYKPNEIEKSIDKNNFGFMFAPNYHSAMKYVANVRKKIGKRTIFNLIGPLSSPAHVKRQVVGVFEKKWLLPFANALINLNSQHAWIVHSEDGMDEISPFAKTYVVEIKEGKINEFEISPTDLDLKNNNLDDLIGKDATYNANKIIELFDGKLKNSFFNAVCLNAAGGLIVANKKNNFKEAFLSSCEHILTGKVKKHLENLKNIIF